MRSDRWVSGARAGVVLAALACMALSPTPYALSSEGPATVLVDTTRPEGRFSPESIGNISCDAIYGQVTSPVADPALAWARATNALGYVRCYNWLGDGVPKDRPEWFSGCRVARSGPNGETVYQWEALERVLDTLVASGLKPVIVCGGIPDALAAGPVRRNEGGQAVNRPRDYARYQDMIAQMLRRLVKTYGADEVRSWYFEVWSQPDHEGSWEGGRPAPFTGEVTAEQVEPFTRLYDHFAAGATSVDEKVRIGGPGLAGDASFLKRFLEHCARGASAVTGKRGARLDFISWHGYGPVSEVVRRNAELRAMVAKEFPELAGARFLLTESGPAPAEAGRSNTAAEAARLAALLDGNARSERPMDLLFRSGDLADDHFDGSRPLVTRIGDNTVPLPALRLMMLATKMGGERLRTETPVGVGALATRPTAKAQQNATQVLLYRHGLAASPSDAALPVRLRISGLPKNLLRLPMRLYRIDPETNAPFEAWEAAGKTRPAPASLGQKLAGDAPFAPAEENLGLPISGGEAVLDVKLPPDSVALVTLGAEPLVEAAICPRGRRLLKAEEEFAEAADLVRARNTSKAIEALRRLADRYADTFWREACLMSLVGIYEADLRSPEQAEATRRELLALPLDDITRVRLLQRLRIDMVRKGNTRAVEDLGREIRAIEDRLTALRHWPLKRYSGNG